jgi:hypothetical protein
MAVMGGALKLNGPPFKVKNMTTSSPLEQDLRLLVRDGRRSDMLTDARVWAGSGQGGEL